ncbi:MAG TPA: hypothetical protein VM184_07440 [Gaiellaceae bacterium]|nr:hypothetical protein [Gaiellaceae bacterium]
MHDRFEEEVLSPCLALDELGRRLGVPFTFFYPLTELAASHTDAEALARKLAERNELGVHAHLASASWGACRLRESLALERVALERLAGGEIVTVRAGGYNTGDQADWISAASGAGLVVDSSVWAGASSTTGEGARGGTRFARAWGRDAVCFDYRRAPTAGLYRVAEDDLTTPGSGPLVEAPIASAFYDEEEPGPFRLDPHRMPLGLLLRTVAAIASRAERRGLAVVMLHTPRIERRGRLTQIGRRLERLLVSSLEEGATVRTLGSVRELDLDEYGPIYAPDQPEGWHAVDRSDLLPLVARCPRCGAGLEGLECTRCGWAGRRLTATLVEAVAAPVPHPPPGPTSRAARYLRVMLALSGGLLAAAVGSTLYAALRLRRLIARGLRQDA